MAATKTTEFSHTADYTNSNSTYAKNLALQALCNALVAAPPSGWSLITSSIPTPTTSTLTYSVTFQVDSTYQVRLFATSISSLRVDIISNSGATTQLAYSTTQVPIMAESGAYIESLNVIITSYAVADNFKVYVITGHPSQSLKLTFGKIFLTEKVSGSPDYAVFNSSATTALMCSTALIRNLNLNYVALSKNASGNPYLSDVYTYFDSAYGYLMTGKLLLTKGVSSALYGSGYEYTLGTDTYLRIGVTDIFVKIS